MITIKSKHELKIMQKAGQISKAALLAAGDLVAPGVTTRQLDEAARRVIEKAGAKPAFLGYGGFPRRATSSASIRVRSMRAITETTPPLSGRGRSRKKPRS